MSGVAHSISRLQCVQGFRELLSYINWVADVAAHRARGITRNYRTSDSNLDLSAPEWLNWPQPFLFGAGRLEQQISKSYKYFQPRPFKR